MCGHTIEECLNCKKPSCDGGGDLIFPKKTKKDEPKGMTASDEAAKRERVKAYKRDYYEKRRLAHLCQDCGRPVTDGATRCQECTQRRREYMNRRNKSKRSG